MQSQTFPLIVMSFSCVLSLAACDHGLIGVGGPVVSGDPADPCGGSAAQSEPPRPMLSADCKITAGSCPHLGRDVIHDICADAHAKNVIWDDIAYANRDIPMWWYVNPPVGRAGQGCDAKMGERNFDALSWDSNQEYPILWEVKTEDYDGQSPYIKSCILNNAIKTYVGDCTSVTTCDTMIDQPELKIRYHFSTWDEELYRDLIDYLAAHPERLPADAARWCNVDLATACKNGPQP